MSSVKDGTMIILSSPSGAGKTTLTKKISAKDNFTVSISHTTRPPRTNEINGKDYIFVDKDDFNQLIKNNQFLEHAEVFKNFYGSGKEKVYEELNNGKNVVFDIDWQGTEQIKKKKLNYKLITFFILPPSKKVLLDRLIKRDLKDEKIVNERMKQFEKDLQQWKNYDYVVINDDLERCYNEITSIINDNLNNEKVNYDFKNIENHIKKLLV
jgi:guanylate kinase|tara:strand:- start:245 stop:877 length:633 start_codon:yes stop_codon:yes gene_type:complete